MNSKQRQHPAKQPAKPAEMIVAEKEAEAVVEVDHVVGAVVESEHVEEVLASMAPLLQGTSSHTKHRLTQSLLGSLQQNDGSFGHTRSTLLYIPPPPTHHLHSHNLEMNGSV